MLRSFKRKLFCEKDELIAKLNETKKLVEKYKNLAEISLEKLKEFECLNMDLDAKQIGRASCRERVFNWV